MEDLVKPCHAVLEDGEVKLHPKRFLIPTTLAE
jgi:hypothetical protein